MYVFSISSLLDEMLFIKQKSLEYTYTNVFLAFTVCTYVYTYRE